MSNKKDIFDAIMNGSIEDIRYFIKVKKVDINKIRDSNYIDSLPLHFAINNRKNEAAKFLIESGADVNIWDVSDGTVLHRAASQKGNIDMVKYLVSKGANVNAKIMNGTLTPIDMTDEVEIIEYLKSKGGKSAKNPRGGCYIATAVYGSYDCPQVWILRRYRDNSLANNIFGRLFINIYYTVSPFIVKVFGRKNWFTRFCRSMLDKIISVLRVNNYKDTPYYD